MRSKKIRNKQKANRQKTEMERDTLQQKWGFTVQVETSIKNNKIKQTKQ